MKHLTAVLASSATLTLGMVTCPSASAAPAGKINAYYVSASSSVETNKKLLRSTHADAITFGYTIAPVKSFDGIPSAVLKKVAGKRAYYYKGSQEWSASSHQRGDYSVKIGKVRWDVLIAPNNSVVITSNRYGDSLKALSSAGNSMGAKTIIGLPIPQKKAREAWLPDTSYLPVVQSFTSRFVRDALAEGADGFYQSTEMPVTNTSYWNSVRTLYTVQNKAVASVRKHSLVIISPFLEARVKKAHFTPAQAASGARMLMRTAQGTNLKIAPQDGLGTGTTALAVDHRSGYIATTEAYFKAMRKAIGPALWVNIENMSPVGTNRKSSTAARVNQQLAASRPYVSGTISYVWDDSTRYIGMKYIKGGNVFAAGFGHTR